MEEKSFSYSVTCSTLKKPNQATQSSLVSDGVVKAGKVDSCRLFTLISSFPHFLVLLSGSVAPSGWGFDVIYLLPNWHFLANYVNSGKQFPHHVGKEEDQRGEKYFIVQNIQRKSVPLVSVSLKFHREEREAERQAPTWKVFSQVSWVTCRKRKTFNWNRFVFHLLQLLFTSITVQFNSLMLYVLLKWVRGTFKYLWNSLMISLMIVK